MQAARDPQDGDDAERIDLLRRRLYRADATEEDVRRFLAERPTDPGADAAPSAGGGTPPPVAPPARVPRRALFGGAAVLAGTAALTALVRFDPGTPRVAGPSSGAEASPRAGELADIGEGRTLAVDRDAVAAPVRAATSVRGVAAVGLRYEGRGNAVVAFHPPTSGVQGGRMMVVLTAAGVAPVAWRALLTVRRSEGGTYPAVLARGRTQEPWGMAGPTTFLYPTVPPTRIAVEAPGGTGWSLLVAVTDGIEPALR